MEFRTTGRLGNVTERNGGYVAFGVAEPSFKKEGSEDWITPWSNFIVKADSSIGKFLVNNASKIDVVEVTGREREGKDANGNTTYYHNVTSVNVITWKKTGEPVAEGSVANEESNPAYPWE